MREIVLDTETTGLNPLQGDRIVEIGCVELVNLLPTGKIFHGYFNPERAMPDGAAAVHGLTDDFLADKPVFAESAGAFLDFIEDAPLVIHNALFDIGFLNAEMERLGFPAFPQTRAVDTLALARKMFPGAPASLDALCKRFAVDLSGREWHGALLDARLLAEVYLELRGGRQPDLAIAKLEESGNVVAEARLHERRAPRAHTPTKEEKAAHQEFLAQIKNPLWRRKSGT
jgi:DNA polymerase-3 subunit epsilon